MSDPSPLTLTDQRKLQEGLQCGKSVHAFQRERALRKPRRKPSDWQGREKLFQVQVEWKQEDIRDVTRKKGIKKAEEIIILGRVGKWGQRSKGVQRGGGRLWREDMGREALPAAEAWCPYGLQLLGGSLASPSPRCSLSAQARLWLALKHFSNGNHLRGGCIFSQDSDHPDGYWRGGEAQMAKKNWVLILTPLLTTILLGHMVHFVPRENGKYLHMGSSWKLVCQVSVVVLSRW